MLLERKNQCLRSMHQITQEVYGKLISNEPLETYENGEFVELRKLQEIRNGLIETMTRLDKEISQLLSKAKELPNLTTLEAEKNQLIRSILSLDQSLYSELEKLKSKVVQQLNSVQSGRKTISAYKSPQQEIELAEGGAVLDQEV
ncbi:MAG: hypothetical protein AB7F43_02835 [Bacteriovoracia bacterium]